MIRKIGVYSTIAGIIGYHTNRLVGLNIWRTHSMEPLLNVGDCVVIYKTGKTSEQDVVVF